MKHLIASALLCCLPGMLWAQNPAKPVEKKAKPSASRVEAHSKANQMAAGVAAAEAALTPEELAIAERIHLGVVPCELGAAVTVSADAKNPGYFHLHTKGAKYRMQPVVTSTGAVRLEDPKAGAVWLQLANKSMLMNQKLGKRIADDCMNPDQLLVTQALARSPGPHLLDAPKDALVPFAPGKTAQEMVPNATK